MRALFAFVLGFGVVGFATADDKKEEPKASEHAKKILGKWEITKAGGDVGPGSTLEFGKDGKFVMGVKAGDEVQKVSGTYKIEKDNLTIILKAGDQSFDQTLVIKKLTDDAMELEDKDKMIDVLKKVK